jgi:pimeloyl-ACP methyl ester carboxylesterase
MSRTTVGPAAKAAHLPMCVLLVLGRVAIDRRRFSVVHSSNSRRQSASQRLGSCGRVDDRAPLLFIVGGKDHLMPPSVVRSKAKKYRNSEATTETFEFPDRSHFTGVEPGWEQVADYALEWATSHARTPQG